MSKSLLNIQHWKTTKGAQVYFVQRRGLAIVDIEIIFNAGSAYDGSKPGVSQLTNCMLNQGTKHSSADELALKLENAGVEFGVTSDRDVGKIGIRSLKDSSYLNQALQILTEVVCTPIFSKNAFLRMHKLVLMAIERQTQTPESIAKNAFYAHVYPHHPYSHSVLGTSETVKLITIEDLKNFFNTYYVSQNAVINIVGDIDRKKAELIAESLIRHLPTGKPAPIIPLAPIANKKTKHIYFPSEQTHILIGQVGIRYDHPDYYPVLIGNDILGGSLLTSRLFRTIRETHGLTYSVFSALSQLKAGGPFAVILQTHKNQSRRAFKLTRQVLDEFIVKGPTQKELIGSQKKFVNGLPLAMAKNYDVMDVLFKISSYCLPPDDMDHYRDHINNVTNMQIKNAFEHHFPMNKMVTIKVGDNSD